MITENLEVLSGDIFTSGAQTLANPINCVGVMGKGLALEFRNRFPDMFRDYETRCKKREVKLGMPYLYKPLIPPWVLLFPSKEHWRSVSSIKDIEAGLQYLVENYQKWGITSLAVPPIGCGLGQLEWRDVGPLMCKYLSTLNIPVWIYLPAEKKITEDLLSKEFLLK